jgi:hypothetical protein
LLQKYIRFLVVFVYWNFLNHYSIFKLN